MSAVARAMRALVIAAGFAAAATILSTLSGPIDASAHALLHSADPAPDSTLAGSPPTVTLSFGEPADPKLSSIRVLDTGGRDHTAGKPEAVAGYPNELRVAVQPLENGVYTVAWRTVSAVDRHVAAGSFAFGVGESPSAAQAGAPGTAAGGTPGEGSGPSPAATIARWLLYLGLVLLLGAGFVGFAISQGSQRVLVRLAALGWLASAAGTVGIVAVQWAESGADVGTILGSSIGYGAFERGLATSGAAIIVAVLLAWPGEVERWLYGLAAAGAAAGMLIDVVTGHAAAGSLSSLEIAAQWFHALAAGLWIGGLVALLLSIRGLPNDEKAAAARRFSWWAGIAIGVVAATGVVRAVAEVGTIDALLGSDFGRLVVLKTVLLAVLAALGAANRFVSIPAAARSLVGLRRIGSAEVALGSGVLLATALLVNLAPPASAGAVATAPAGPPPLVSTGNDFGTSVRERLVVTSGAPGFNQFSVGLTDFDSGAPLDALSVTLRFDLESRSDVGSSSLELHAVGAGTYSGSGGNLSIDGIWRITTMVQAPGSSVEVPLAIATRIAPQNAAATPAAGAPTIYTVALDQGGSVQLYLDPGAAGQNELHATFFDAAGTESPVPTATFLVVPSDGVASIVVPRQLEPGHFVADLSVGAGNLAVDVVAPVPGTDHAHGDQLHVHLLLDVTE